MKALKRICHPNLIPVHTRFLILILAIDVAKSHDIMFIADVSIAYILYSQLTAREVFHEY